MDDVGDPGGSEVILDCVVLSEVLPFRKERSFIELSFGCLDGIGSFGSALAVSVLLFDSLVVDNETDLSFLSCSELDRFSGVRDVSVESDDDCDDVGREIV